jgi:uncharacterized protein
LRIVLDTNVLVSALITEGKSRQLLEGLFVSGETLLISEPILDEFLRVTAEERFRRYIQDDDVTRFLKVLLYQASFVRIKSRFKVLESPDDEVLRTAKDGRADVIVSGGAPIESQGVQGNQSRIGGGDARSSDKAEARLTTVSRCVRILCSTATARRVDEMPRRRRNEPYAWRQPDSRAVNAAPVINLLHQHQTFLATDFVKDPVIPDPCPVNVLPPLELHDSPRKRVITQFFKTLDYP